AVPPVTAVPTRGVDVAAPRAATPLATARAERSAADRAARETVTVPGDLPRAAVRKLVERVLADKIPGRTLQPRDYDRLTDAVIRMRTAMRALRDAGREDPAVVEAQREALASALAEIERTTGVAAVQLGELVTADETAPDAADAGPHTAR